MRSMVIDALDQFRQTGGGWCELLDNVLGVGIVAAGGNRRTGRPRVRGVHAPSGE